MSVFYSYVKGKWRKSEGTSGRWRGGRGREGEREREKEKELRCIKKGRLFIAVKVCCLLVSDFGVGFFFKFPLIFLFSIFLKQY